MRLLSVLVCMLALGTQVAFCQDQILAHNGVTIQCRIESATSQWVRYTSRVTSRIDSLLTLDVHELRYANSQRVLVVPSSERGRVRVISYADFDKAIRNNDYATLLHSKASTTNLAFVSGQLSLTTEGRRQALALAALLKAKPALRIRLLVHTDTLGRAATNKALSDRRALALRNLLIANGVLSRNLTAEGRGESEAYTKVQLLNRRVELQVVSIEHLSELYAEPVIPPRSAVPVLEKPTSVSEAVSQIDKSQLRAPKERRIGVILYGEGLYALESLSKTWVNPDQGIGILQGFGGGALVTYFVTPRFGLTFQGGYGQWKVQRRYETDEGDVVYTNDQELKRILGQIGFRLYALPTVYIQPMGGGQLLILTSQNSATHPDGALSAETKKFMPTFGGAIGFELGKKSLLVDIAIQYQMTPNSDFNKATEPLHYAGLRLGAGFRPRR